MDTKAKSRTLTVFAVALALAVGLAIGLLIGRVFMDTRPINSDSKNDEITAVVKQYVAAFNTGDAETLGKLSCGGFKQSFDSVGAASVRSQAKESTSVRGEGTVTATQNASVENDRATIVATVKYANKNPNGSNVVTSVFGLKKPGNSGWQLCWSFPVGNQL